MTRKVLIMMAAAAILLSGATDVFHRPMKILYYGDSFDAYRTAIRQIETENFPAMLPIQEGGHTLSGWMVTQNYTLFWPLHKEAFAVSKPDWIFFQDAGRVDPDFAVTMRHWVPEAVDSGLKVVITDNCDSASWYITSTNHNNPTAQWFPDNAVARELADRYGQIFLPMSLIETCALKRVGEAAILADGLHPNSRGYLLGALALMKAWGADIKTLTVNSTGCPADTAAIFVAIVDSVMNAFDRFYAKTMSGLSLSPSAGSLPEWTTLPLSATALYSDTTGQKPFSGRAYWTSLNPGTATVSPIGLVRGTAPGQVRIVAVYNQYSDTTELTVTANTAAVDSIRIFSSKTALQIGDTLPLRCTAYYANGGVRSVSGIVVWMSSVPSALTLTPSAAVAQDSGTVLLSATFGGKSHGVTLSIAPPQPAVLLADFGRTQLENRFGVQGWSWVIHDTYTDYTAVRPGGFAPGTAANNSQGVTQSVNGHPLYFAKGDRIRATWYNLYVEDLPLAPFLSFATPGNRLYGTPPGSWQPMTPGLLPGAASVTTEYGVTQATAGFHSIVNVSMGNNIPDAIVACDKIEWIKAGLSGVPADAVLDSVRMGRKADTLVAGDSAPVSLLAYFHKAAETYTAVADDEAAWSSGAPARVQAVKGIVQGLASGAPVKVAAAFKGLADTLTLTVLPKPAFIRRINFQCTADPFKAGWLADNGAVYSAAAGYGWSALRTASDCRQGGQLGNNFLFQTFVSAIPPVGYRIDAPDGDYLIRFGLGGNNYGIGALNWVASGGDTIARYVGGSTRITDSLRGIYGQANGIIDTIITVTGGNGIRLMLYGTMDYVVVCSAAEGTPMSFIADDEGSPVNTTVSAAEAGMDETGTSAQITVAPNPFNPLTRITVRNIKALLPVNLSIFDVRGSLVVQMASLPKSGKTAFEWNAGRLSSGVYFLRVSADNETFRRKIILTR